MHRTRLPSERTAPSHGLNHPQGNLHKRLCRTQSTPSITFRLFRRTFETFEELIQRIVAATSEEPDTTTYEYVVNADHTVVHIVERYRPLGLLPHVEQTFTPFAKRFLELAKIEKLFVYGDTTPEIRAKLDGFEASINAVRRVLAVNIGRGCGCAMTRSSSDSKM